MTETRPGAAAAFDPILEGALDAFSDLGYRGATMRGIARHIGVKVPQIYYRYPSKECLLSELMLTSARRQLEIVEAASVSSPDPLARLARMIDGLVRFGCREPRVVRLSAESRSMAADKREQYLSMRAAIEDHLTDAVARGVALGVCESTAPRLDVRAVLGMVQALALSCGDGESDEDRIAARAVVIALRTVGACERLA